ncbi:MAG: tetratricopeptide repeat protein [Candidatus Heimdallarchaeota archaeon]|nr:tetratricopeptide repeat protein [Candidatus Heimdallarchaeota archaeon]
MGIEDSLAIEMDKIVSEMKIIIEMIENNGRKVNEAIAFRVQGIYHDFWITQVPDKKLLSDFYFSVGLGYQLLEDNGERKNAIKYLTDALYISQELLDYNRLYEIYNEIGISYYELKKNDMAYHYYELSYQLGIDNKLDDYKIATSLVNLSTLNTRKGAYKMAIIQLNKSLELFAYDPMIKYNEETQIYFGSLYHNLAINHVQLFEYKEAIKYYKLGLKLNRNKEEFRSKVIKRIRFVMKDLEDNIEFNSLEDLIVKINHLK